MEILAKARSGLGSLADIGISLIALGIVAEVLGVPMLTGMSVIDNVSGIITSLGSQGLMGLVAIWVLYEIWNKR
tara:strand:- start:1842 stop:2063 length:222 start_codon:yes stop_codon:yes gene_type:complete